MKRLAVILFALALMAVSSSAMAVNFGPGGSSPDDSNSWAQHLVEPDFIGGPRWVGALWDCWRIAAGEDPYYLPNYWDASATAGAPDYVRGQIEGTPSDTGPRDGIIMPYIPLNGSGALSGDYSYGGALTGLTPYTNPNPQGSGQVYGFEMHLDNFDSDGGTKDVAINIRYQGGLVSGFTFDYTDDGGAYSAPYIGADYALNQSAQDGDWTDAYYYFTPQCDNPDDEVITMYFDNPNVIIDWVIVDTQCNAAAVPLPGAVWLLGSGMVGLLGMRRKFRKNA